MNFHLYGLKAERAERGRRALEGWHLQHVEAAGGSRSKTLWVSIGALMPEPRAAVMGRYFRRALGRIDAESLPCLCTLAGCSWEAFHVAVPFPWMKGGWNEYCGKIRGNSERIKQDLPCLSEAFPSTFAPWQVIWAPTGVMGTCTGERFLAGSMHQGHFSWRKAICFQSTKMWAREKYSVCSAFNPNPHTLQVPDLQLIMSDPFTLLEKLFIITIVLAWHLSPQ